MNEGILTQETIERLIMSLAESGGGLIDEDDAVKIIRWAEEAEVNSMLLANVMDGYLDISVEEGEIIFKITEKAAKELKTFEHLKRSNPEPQDEDEAHVLLQMPEDGNIH